MNQTPPLHPPCRLRLTWGQFQRNDEQPLRPIIVALPNYTNGAARHRGRLDLAPGERVSDSLIHTVREMTLRGGSYALRFPDMASAVAAFADLSNALGFPGADA